MAEEALAVIRTAAAESGLAKGGPAPSPARHAVTVELVETAVEDIEFKVPRILREPA